MGCRPACVVLSVGTFGLTRVQVSVRGVEQCERCLLPYDCYSRLQPLTNLAP